MKSKIIRINFNTTNKNNFKIISPEIINRSRIRIKKALMKVLNK